MIETLASTSRFASGLMKNSISLRSADQGGRDTVAERLDAISESIEHRLPPRGYIVRP